MDVRPDAPAATPHKLLVVSGSDAETRLLAGDLAAHGILVDYRRVARDLDMASELAQSDWDLILCDDAVPGFEAFSALNELGRSGRDVPFIIYSRDPAGQHAAAMRRGAVDVVTWGDYERLVPVFERELRAVSARRAVQRAGLRMRELAYFDALSSLPNQELFCRKIGDWLSDCVRRGRSPGGALLVVDIDRFMRINASFGYHAGSELLRAVALRLAASVGPEAILARLRGDTFGVFVPGARLEGAEVLARKLVASFESAFRKDHVELFITASVGVALAPRDGESVYDLLLNAEIAVARAKRGGGNAARFYERGMNLASAERIALEADLRHAVERGELFLHYQPIIDVRTGMTAGAEALLRWRHATLGMIPPDRFIPLADEAGLIGEIGAWVLERACEQGRRWHRRGWEGFRVSVNVSAVQFAEPRLIEVVSGVLRRTGFMPECLTLEITETSIMEDVESAVGMLRALKNMGVHVAVDDFGTGYSSLAYLKRLPIDILKIDKSFVRDVCQDADGAAIARAIIALARNMRLATVAEGVETEAQEAALRGESCDFLQGYRFGRPVPADTLARYGLCPIDQ